MKIKISVLVPIYNSAEYLQQCLASLEEQTLNSLEFILINDGSIDESLGIMEEYKNKDVRFKIVDKKNTGYGDSLNKAIKLANGEYIGIVEPDDFCDKKMFEVLYGLAKEEKADIVRGGYYEYSEEAIKKHSFRVDVKGKEIFRPIEDYEVFFEVPAIWSAIYKKELLINNKIGFLPTAGAAYQDTGFNFKTLACADKVVYTNDALYYYRVDNPNSSVKDLRKSMAVVKEFGSIESFIQKLPEHDLLAKYCQVAKFGAYHWNLGHLEKKVGKKFVRVMKEEFIEARKAGLLEKKYFPKKYWLSLNVLLNGPVSLYYGLFVVRNYLK